jgi:uncharacterized circularly permuted ATP-grasp superfamily protein/uncharacterized alpha-E superfamily protein
VNREVPNATLASYAVDAQRYDELLDATGAVRPHWRGLIDRLAAPDARETPRRGIELTRRLIIENGVTYNVYADPQGADRPWALDPLPLMLSAEEWCAIEEGVSQRARVLDALLADLYGPQRLLAEGVIPPELPFGHPNFLWPCHGIGPGNGNRLHIYAADLARAPDGRWWVLADRTQAPSGAGYALENREIVEQVLPQPIRDLGVRRVRGFFSELRASMLSHAGAGESPLAVILTPGPFNETYFEHAYLSRQLGLPLVEGQDLSVRGDTVYMKTLGGLRRVHAILRRLDDDYCDPVELRSDSALGVPGLIGAVRAGRVVLANALGTGVLESAAWLGFLPGVCERLLGEKLALPAVATWWCGERPALDYVLENLDHLVLKPTYPNQRFEPIFGRELAGESRAKFIEALKARPYAYVAQEHVALSQAPVWRTGGVPGFAAKAVTLRVYVAAAANRYSVMPGGLARVATDVAVDVVSAQRGGGSKDIWVLSDAARRELELPGQPSWTVALRHDDVPSRLVENMYWLGRYKVRCADKARLLRSTLAARIDRSVWVHAVRVCREVGAIQKHADPALTLRDDRHAQGIVADIKRLAWCASQVRSRLSGRYWRAVVGLQRLLQEAGVSSAEPREALERLLLSLAALIGFAAEDMTHDEGWRLMRIGRRLERLQFVAELLAHHLRSQAATRQQHLEWLLEACDSTGIYRSRYVVTPRLGPVLDLLIRDADHPTALAFQYNSVHRDLAELAKTLDGADELGMDQGVPQLDERELAQLDAEGGAARAARRLLADQLMSLSAAAGELSNRLSMRHFSLTSPEAYSQAN